jgi:hypothetical protein
MERCSGRSDWTSRGRKVRAGSWEPFRENHDVWTRRDVL